MKYRFIRWLGFTSPRFCLWYIENVGPNLWGLVWPVVAEGTVWSNSLIHANKSGVITQETMDRFADTLFPKENNL